MRLITVPVVVCVLMAGAVTESLQAREAALGRKLDNYLNHNLPFLELEYTCRLYSPGGAPDGPLHQDPCSGPNCETMIDRPAWDSAFCSESLSFEFYDEMDAAEKIRTDSNNQFEQVFGYLGDGLVSGAFGAVASRLGAGAAARIGAGVVGQWLTGAFSDQLVGVAGSGAGSW
jgi:hypothetical protein